MRGSLEISAAFARLRSRALGTTALTVLAVTVAPAAWAQTAPTGKLPGTFYTNEAVTTGTYQGTSATEATITIDTTAGHKNAVLQWGGTTTGLNQASPTGTVFTTNTGFSIASGATLTIKDGATAPTSVLVTDQTGSASQIFGKLDASGLGTAPLFVSNASGVFVAKGAQITAPKGIGLLGYLETATAFGDDATGGTVSSNSSGTGPVTIEAGASINGTGGQLLVATNGTVKIGATTDGTSGNQTYVVDGYQFTAGASTVVPSLGTTPTALAASPAVVNITQGGTATINTLYSAGAVNNSGNLTLPASATVAVDGLFTNAGVLNDNGNLGSNHLAGGLVNSGVVNESATAGLTITSTKGNIQNTSTGTLNLLVGSTGSLDLEGANVDLEGTVAAGATPKALSSSNPIATLTVKSTDATPTKPGGVVDIGTSLFTTGDVLVSGNAIRVLSGGITASTGNIVLNPGTKASAVTDPFYNNQPLNYTFSLFGGTLISAKGTESTITVENAAGTDPGTSFSTSSGLNLNGQLSASVITVVANNINSNNGLNGGFVVPDKGEVDLTVYGNVNNPNGAAANGSSSFLYNYVPVTVGANGTATIKFVGGPSATSSLEQNVNLLVSGNVNLESVLASPVIPNTTSPSYANNHLVVTATGNVGFDSGATSGGTFYWPGLVYLTSGATASNPTAAPNATASISLANAHTGGSGTVVNLNNLIPADLTTASVGGQTGHGGIFFETNNLSLSTGTVTISNDSWANFLTPALASAFHTTSNGNFFGGVISGATINTQKLPAGDFQPQ